MSTITQAVDGLLAGLLLPATRLLWIHAFSKWSRGSGSRLSFAGRLHGRWVEESNQMRRTKASWDRADFEVCGQREVLEKRHPMRRSSCDDIADNCRDNEAVSRSGVHVAGREDRAAGKNVIRCR